MSHPTSEDFTVGIACQCQEGPLEKKKKITPTNQYQKDYNNLSI